MKTCTDIRMSGCQVGGYITVTCEDRQRLEAELAETKRVLDATRSDCHRLNQKVAGLQCDLADCKRDNGVLRWERDQARAFKPCDLAAMAWKVAGLENERDHLKQELGSTRFALDVANDVNRSQAAEIEKLKKELEDAKASGGANVSDLIGERDYLKAESESLKGEVKAYKDARDMVLESCRGANGELNKAREQNDLLMKWIKLMPRDIRSQLQNLGKS